MIKAIVFDLGGVLVPLNREACIDAFRAIGVDGFANMLDKYVQGGFFLEYEKGLIDTDRFREIIKESIEDREYAKNLDNSLIDKAMGAFLGPIAQFKLDLLIELKRSYPLYMLSNTNPIAIEVVRPFFNYSNLKMEEFFNRLFLSYEMKMAKPDTDIFIKMIKEIGLPANEILFIDDAIANIKSAESVGLTTIFYTDDLDLKKEIYRLL